MTLRSLLERASVPIVAGVTVPDMRPTVDSIVHYSNDEASCRDAVITGVQEHGVDLYVDDPLMGIHVANVPARGSESQRSRVGEWHWPEGVCPEDG